MGEIAVLLAAWREGDRAALDELTPLVYQELHRLAERHMQRERRDHTLGPTALVAEAVLRLAGGAALPEADRLQFFAIASAQMRRVLVDHARRRVARKRGGGGKRAVTFDESLAAEDRPEDVLQLDEALAELARFDARKAEAIQLHYFAGLTHKEIAGLQELHENTVARDLKLAVAWLNRYLQRAVRE